MKNKIVKLTENDLKRIVQKVINEDFGTRLVSRFKGFINALRAGKDGEGRDAKQLIKAITRLQSTAEQSSPLLNDIQNDLNLLFKEDFMSRVERYNEKNMSNQGLGQEIEDFKKELEEYRTLIGKVIEKNEMIKNLS
jgi:hypothetical protein